MSRLFQKRLNKEIQLYQKENYKFPNLILRYDTSNYLKWYFIVHGLIETPYENGVYYGKIQLPNEYPLKAPDFYFMTPNGRFEINKKICTSFSGFHQESYTSVWNILTMMEGLISYMTEEDPVLGVGSIKTTDIEKIKLAKNSLEWNKTNNEFIEIFPDFKELLNS